jgi:hypothetical protein
MPTDGVAAPLWCAWQEMSRAGSGGRVAVASMSGIDTCLSMPRLKMTLQKKMTVSMSIVFLLFAAALAIAISGMRQATARFESFI